MIHPYQETLLSHLYPGNQHSTHCLEPAVLTFEQRLLLPPQHRAKIVWRLDGGFGGDDNIGWLLERNYQVLAKGCSHRRAAKLATQVKRWLPVRADKFVGRVATPVQFARPVETFVIRHQTSKGWKHSYLFSTLKLSSVPTVRYYEQRGGAETEFRSDKSGLRLHKRRKHKRDAQEVWVILTDVVHNYLAWFAHTILADSPFAKYGLLRISRDLLRIPGYVEMHQGKLLSVKLLRSSPHAADLIACLERFWD
jgi:hypothetical protein